MDHEFIDSVCAVFKCRSTYSSQPMLDARVVGILHLDGLQFKDLNRNGKVDVYEDWRQPVDQRVANLLSHMIT